MSDEDSAVEEQAEDEEIVVVDKLPEEEPEAETPAPDPELEKLRRENADLKARGDTGAAIKDGFAFLQERLSTAGVPAQHPASVDDEETFWKGVEEGLFDKQPREALKKAVDRQARKLVRDELGPLIVAQMEAAFENAEWRLRNDAKEGEIFTLYEKEVRAELSKLNPVQQKDPRELKNAYLRVKAAHVDEIIEARTSKASEQATAAARKPASAKPAVLMEGANAHPGAAPKKKVFITRAEEARIKRLGMTTKDYLDLKESRKASS
jgi:hypothetical protein